MNLWLGYIILVHFYYRFDLGNFYLTNVKLTTGQLGCFSYIIFEVAHGEELCGWLLSDAKIKFIYIYIAWRNQFILGKFDFDILKTIINSEIVKIFSV